MNQRNVCCLFSIALFLATGCGTKSRSLGLAAQKENPPTSSTFQPPPHVIAPSPSPSPTPTPVQYPPVQSPVSSPRPSPTPSPAQNPGTTQASTTVIIVYPPTVTLQAAQTALPYYNAGTTFSWVSTHASNCIVSNSLTSQTWTGVSGNYPTGPIVSNISYSIACSGVGGVTAPQTVTITRGDIPKSCREIITANSRALSGQYTLDPDGASGLAPIAAYCDMVTDGGGWTLVLNYLHLGGTNPTLNPRLNSLPVLGSSTLGVNEAGSVSWGHTEPSLLAKFSFAESRWYCKSSGHSRIVDFKTGHFASHSYLTTGKGSMSGVEDSFSPLASHTANIPFKTDVYFGYQGNKAMTEFPFYKSGSYHWALRGFGSRWECDDWPNDARNHTFHQVWIR